MKRQFALTADDKPLIERLSPKLREIISITGSYAQIGAALQIPLGTVRSRLNRARDALTRLREEELSKQKAA